MRESESFVGTVRQYVDELEFTDSELADRANLYLATCAGDFYNGDIVKKSGYGDSRRSGFTTKEGKMFGEVLTDVLLKSELKIPVNEKCTYNRREERKAAINALQGDLSTISKKKGYCRESETRLMQVLAMLENISGYNVVDYQIPTTNGTKRNIDIFLEKDGVFYMTEAKRFKSSEQLVRCVLEIQTYYCKLNDLFFELYHCTRENLRKAVMFDETSFAYQQLSYPWAKKLLKKFDITVLVLSETEEGYTITEWA